MSELHWTSMAAEDGQAAAGARRGQPSERSSQDRTARHRAAVAKTLSWADEAAAREDYAGALAWLQTVEAIGDALSDAYLAKRRTWHAMLVRAAARR